MLKYRIARASDDQTQVRNIAVGPSAHHPPPPHSRPQVWLPQQDDDGSVNLRTKGFPFCVAGMGDLLALFRCVSCRFSFGTDPGRPDRLGAPGRVFLTGEPELACNVRHYPQDAYLRRAEAEQCQVQSSMLLPVFAAPPGGSPEPGNAGGGGRVLGVVEVVQTSDDMKFLPMVQALGQVLQVGDSFFMQLHHFVWG